MKAYKFQVISDESPNVDSMGVLMERAEAWRIVRSLMGQLALAEQVGDEVYSIHIRGQLGDWNYAPTPDGSDGSAGADGERA